MEAFTREVERQVVSRAHHEDVLERVKHAIVCSSPSRAMKILNEELAASKEKSQ